MRGAMMRTTVSNDPPAAAGTTMVIGRVGYGSAPANPTPTKSPPNAMEINFFMLSSLTMAQLPCPLRADVARKRKLES